LDGLDAGGHPKMDKSIHMPRVFRRNVFLNIEVLYLPGDASAEWRRVELRDSRYAGLAILDCLPSFAHSVADRRDAPQACYDDAAILISTQETLLQFVKQIGHVAASN
jgi:hypothetical protein